MNREVRILIVEDEFMISEDIAMRLCDFGYIVAGTAPSAHEALEIMEKGHVDLALLDVNIEGDMDGIELAAIIHGKYNIPFIFLTSLANNSIVERAMKTSPSAYLLKPFNDRQVQIAIDLAIVNFSNNTSATGIDQPSVSKTNNPSIITMKESLFLKKDTHFDRVRFDEIYYLAAESNYTLIYTKSGRYIYSTVLKNFEDKLPSDVFVRVHRSYIVNLNAVTGFEGNFLHLGDKHVPVSKTNREDLFKAFKVI